MTAPKAKRPASAERERRRDRLSRGAVASWASSIRARMLEEASPGPGQRPDAVGDGGGTGTNHRGPRASTAGRSSQTARRGAARRAPVAVLGAECWRRSRNESAGLGAGARAASMARVPPRGVRGVFVEATSRISMPSTPTDGAGKPSPARAPSHSRRCRLTSRAGRSRRGLHQDLSHDAALSGIEAAMGRRPVCQPAEFNWQRPPPRATPPRPV